MKQLYRLRAFPKTIDGGNKAAVYIFADDLKTKDMLKIANDIGYSETAFVLKSNKADFKVRFFTPKFEVDLCGHATIATFNLLRDLNIIQPGTYTQETKAGILSLNVTKEMVFMEQSKPVFDIVIPHEELIDCFKHLEFHPHLKPQILSTGLREIFLPLKNTSSLDKMKPNYKKIIEISRKYHVIGIHAFSLDETIDAYGRNFAPIIGINEESATGTSNGALGCYLYKHLVKKKEFLFRQGYQMNQPSEIITHIHAFADEIKAIWVGGNAYLIKEKIVA
ncbi:MAG: PhzF family phenazine biosynthesis protein [Tenericutes bacterium]|jgi:PhzF family phenazine biosynthesis protein|nr:PhzF family phenazine biosynthesis protein [Mycoplasmatota bacterium]